MRKIRTPSEAGFSLLLYWFREECTGTLFADSAEQKYAITLVASISHQGFALIQGVLSGNTFPSAMLARSMLETTRRFVDVSRNGKAALAASLRKERHQLQELKKVQKGDVRIVDPSVEIDAIDGALSALAVDELNATTGDFTHLLGQEAEEYWKLLSRDVHSHPSILLRQFASAIRMGRANSVFERDQENLDAHFDIATYALKKFIDEFIEATLLITAEERTRLRVSYERHLLEVATSDANDVTRKLSIIATYKAPPGHNRLRDVTLAVVATKTHDGAITIEFDDPEMSTLAADAIATNLRSTLLLDALGSRGIHLRVAILSPAPDWVVPQACGYAATEAADQLNKSLSAYRAQRE